MKIGISSWTYSWNLGVAGYPEPENPMSAVGLLEKAHEFDVDVLQIADNLPLEKMTEEEIDRLAQLAEEWKVQIEVGTKGVRPDRLADFIKIAEKLQSPIIRTLLHDENGCPAIEEAEAMIRQSLPGLREKNIILAIENHDFFPVAELKRLVENIKDPHVGICLDPVNNLAQGESTTDVFSALGECTVNFHCKDYTIRRKPSNLGFDVEGCPAGEGLLNLERCRRTFEDREMSYIVELWTPWQGTIEETCKKEREWAEISVQNLKKMKAGGQ